MSTSSKPLIIFSHGNSFPASTYGVLFQSLQARGFQVKAIEKFGHDPRYPVTSNWPNLVQQLADFTQAEVEKSGQPAFLVGHSLGGFLSLMCAASNPALGGQPVRGVVMVDSPILGGWRAKALSVAKRAQLVGSISPGAISRKRRQQWLGRDEVLAHFRSKKAFARWDEQVLRDYIEHGTHDENGSAQGQRHQPQHQQQRGTAHAGHGSTGALPPDSAPPPAPPSLRASVTTRSGQRPPRTASTSIFTCNGSISEVSHRSCHGPRRLSASNPR